MKCIKTEDAVGEPRAPEAAGVRHRLRGAREEGRIVVIVRPERSGDDDARQKRKAPAPRPKRAREAHDGAPRRGTHLPQEFTAAFRISAAARPVLFRSDVLLRHSPSGCGAPLHNTGAAVRILYFKEERRIPRGRLVANPSGAPGRPPAASRGRSP